MNILTKSVFRNRKRAFAIMLFVVMSILGTFITTTSVLAWHQWTSATWASVNPLNYTITTGYPSSWIWSISANVWNGAGTPVNFTYNSSNYKVVLTTEYHINDGVDGRTFQTRNGNTIISTYSYLNTYYTSGYSYPKMQSVACHELGHVLDLGEMATNVLMYVNTDVRWDIFHINTPQTDDINGVNYMY